MAGLSDSIPYFAGSVRCNDVSGEEMAEGGELLQSPTSRGVRCNADVRDQPGERGPAASIPYFAGRALQHCQRTFLRRALRAPQSPTAGGVGCKIELTVRQHVLR